MNNSKIKSKVDGKYIQIYFWLYYLRYILYSYIYNSLKRQERVRTAHISTLLIFLKMEVSTRRWFENVKIEEFNNFLC